MPAQDSNFSVAEYETVLCSALAEALRSPENANAIAAEVRDGLDVLSPERRAQFQVAVDVVCMLHTASGGR